MAFFCTNAQEEALKAIAREMTIANTVKVVRELHDNGALTDEEYIKSLKEILKIA